MVIYDGTVLIKYLYKHCKMLIRSFMLLDMKVVNAVWLQ
jgi:hypothetical protein